MLCPKTLRWENKKWLLEQREQPCVFTGSTETEASHIRIGSHSGTGQKPPDYSVLPVHFQIHRDIHNQGELSTYLRMMNENPLVLAEALRSMAKVRCMKWLAEKGQQGEALNVLFAP